MKKKLLFMSLIAAVSVNAQFTDDIESYPVGPVHTGHWENWGAPSDPTVDAIVSEVRSVSGTKSIFIGPSGQDAVLNLDNKTSGLWKISWKMYVPADSAAYYNFQEVTPVVGGVFSVDFFFNTTQTNGPGEAAIWDDTQTEVARFTYPEGEWFILDHIIDVDNDMIQVLLNDSSVYNGAMSASNSLGGIDFYSIDAKTSYYMDDFTFLTGALAVEESDVTSVKAFPNPTSDVLNITNSELITNVAVYDMLGKQILNMPTSSTSVVLNTTDFAAGTYILKVFTGDKEETLKIIK